MSNPTASSDENTSKASARIHETSAQKKGTPEVLSPPSVNAQPETPNPADLSSTASHIRLMTLALVLIAVIAFSWFGRLLADVVAPVLFAMFLCYMMVPLVNLFQKIKIPRLLGYIFVTLIFVGMGVGMGAMISGSVEQFKDNLPAYEENLKNVVGTAQNVAHRVRLLAPEEELTVDRVIDALPVGGLEGLISGGASYMFGSTSFLVITLFFMLFMIGEGERFTRRVQTAYNQPAAERILKVTRKFNDSIQRYLMLKTLVSAITGIGTYIIMVAFGLEFAGVLAVFVFLSNFVPYVGSIASTILPVALALVQFPTWRTAVFILVGIMVIQQIMGNFVEPRMQGRGLNVSPLLILFYLVYFSWMWGIVGMIVCMPVAAGVRILLEEFESTRPLAKMMSNI